jgi:hypothetical protein
MRQTFLYITLAFMSFGLARTAKAQTIIPAGTLIQCSLNEPNFSSATASVEDPVVCALKSVQEFGHTLLPRGSYLEGRLAAEKEPGHFAGKGYLRLEFDRIGLPGTDIPVPLKVVAAAGYKADRQGDIVGKGHAKRDVAEWMLPPLWPWKVIALPARGPRPTLKGEERLTLRLMDDVIVPKMADAQPTVDSGWHHFGEPREREQVYQQSQSHNFSLSQTSFTRPTQTIPDSSAAVQPRRSTLIALKSGDVLEVYRYRIEESRLSYFLRDGTGASSDAANIDWTRTSQLNSERATTGNWSGR